MARKSVSVSMGLSVLIIFISTPGVSKGVEISDIVQAFVRAEPDVAELPKLIRLNARRHLDDVRNDLPELPFDQFFDSRMLFDFQVRVLGRDFTVSWDREDDKKLQSRGKLLFDGTTLAQVELEVTGPIEDIVRFYGNAACLLVPMLAELAEEEGLERTLLYKDKREQEDREREAYRKSIGMPPIDDLLPIEFERWLPYAFYQKPVGAEITKDTPALLACTAAWIHWNSEASLSLSWQTNSSQMTCKFLLKYSHKRNRNNFIEDSNSSVIIGDNPKQLLYRCLWDMKLHEGLPETLRSKVSELERLARPYLAGKSVEEYWKVKGATLESHGIENVTQAAQP